MRRRFGIVGCGMIGRIYAERLRALGHEVVAAADPDLRRAASVATGGPTFNTARSMLEAGGLDVACVCSPSAFHHEAVLDAAAAGVDVFLEKPMAMTLAEARTMADAMARAGRQLGLGFKMRFETVFSSAQGLIDDGAIGTPRYAVFTFYQPVPPGERSWYVDTGILRDMLVHVFDLSCWMLGSVPADIVASTARTLGYAGEDKASVEMRFVGGGRASVQGGYLPAFPDIAGHEDIIFQIVGEEGYLLGKRPDLLIVVNADGRRQISVSPVDPFAAELDAFAQAIAAGAPLPVSVVDGLRAQAIIDAAERSAAAGGARIECPAW